MKIVSACLAGIKCRYDGETKPCPRIIELVKQGMAIPVCPEQLGGLPTPRVPQEIQGGSGEEVLDGRCKVLNREGRNVTENFLRGAEETLRIARLFSAEEFIGKSKSPSCGCNQTYDGSFSGKLIEGDGVTTALLKRNGIKVITEEDI